MRKQITLFLSLLLTVNIFAQEFTVTGKVSDETGAPIPGVNIIEKGTTNGTVSGIDGTYVLKTKNSEATIIYSFVGYLTEEIPVSGRTQISISLVPDVKTLDEIVLIGYGSINKKDLTGAVSVVDTKKLNNVQALSIGDAIQGLASGVNIRSNGDIGAEPNIKIRGIGNFGNGNPLYVIDDLIVSGGMRDLNVNDIESVQILKDASAAAIYGNRAANGVIIITTKKGKSGDMKVDFSTKFGINKLPGLNLMDTAEYFRYNDMAYQNAGMQIQNHYDNNTNWEDEILKTGYSTEYNIGISGGSNNSSYMISGNYFNNTGTSIGTSLDRYTVRVNTEAKKGIFKIGENFSFSDTRVVPSSSGNPIADAMRMTPDMAVYDSTHPGGFGYGDEARSRTFGTNTVAVQNLVNIHSGNARFRGNGYIEASILKCLKYKMNLGYETSFDSYKRLRKTGNWTLNQPLDPSHIYENKARYQSLLYDNIITFDKDFNGHTINVVLGSSYQHEQYEQISAQKSDVFVSGGNYINVINGGSTNPQAGGFRNEIYRISYFGRLNYDYQGKYLLSATLRRDQSSQFGPDYRTGYFPSASVGWKISEEKFFNIAWLNSLKLRANYGELGNASFENWGGNSGIYDYIPKLTIFPIATFGNGSDNVILNGATQRELVNQDLTWETKKQTNIGLDYGFLENRLQLSTDYFISTTDGVLVEYPIPIATGNDGGNPWVNAGKLQNKGFELEASWKDQIGELSYTVGGNVTVLRNKVLDLPYGDPQITTGLCKTEKGNPIGMFYVIKTDGIFQTEQEVLDHVNSQGVVIQPDAKPGDLRYIDADDNGLISAAGDRQYAGSPWPKFEMGLNFGAEYKAFDFSLQTYGAFGQKIWNGTRAMTERFNDNSNYRKGINPWTPENPNTDFPRVVYADERNSIGHIDRWLENGSFYKIREISVGYTISKLPVVAKYFEALRIGVTAQNVFTFTKYSGLDPEFNNGYVLEFGVDGIAYPTPRTILFSLNAKF